MITNQNCIKYLEHPNTKHRRVYGYIKYIIKNELSWNHLYIMYTYLLLIFVVNNLLISNTWMIIKSDHLPSESKHKIRKRKKCLWHTNAEYNLFLKPFSCMHTHSRSPHKMKLQNLLITNTSVIILMTSLILDIHIHKNREK